MRLRRPFLLLFFLWTIFQVRPAASRVLVIQDAAGRRVEVRVPVKRAVFFIGYELIPYLDLWEQTVGISLWAKRYSDLLKKTSPPGWLRTIPTVGTATQINLEALAVLSPDLIVTWSYRPEGLKLLEDFARKSGAVVIALAPESLKDLYRSMKLLAQVFGRERRLHRVEKAMEEVFSLIQDRLQGLKHRKRVLWLWGDRCHCQVAGGQGVVADLLRLSGGKNCAETLDHPYPRVSPERIVLWDPEVIFIWGNAPFGPKEVLRDRRLAVVTAVKHRAVYKAPAWSTWSPRVALLTLWAAMKLYPERFRGLSFSALVGEFEAHAL